MNDPSKPKPRFWPMVFLVAFAFGALLWGIWMAKVVRQTRDQRNHRDQFFVPAALNPPGPATTHKTPPPP